KAPIKLHTRLIERLLRQRDVSIRGEEPWREPCKVRGQPGDPGGWYRLRLRPPGLIPIQSRGSAESLCLRAAIVKGKNAPHSHRSASIGSRREAFTAG